MCAKFLHQQRASVWNGMLIILMVWYERSCYNKSNTDDNYDLCELLFLEILFFFWWNFTRGHDIKHLMFSEFKFYRLDLLMLWGQFKWFSLHIYMEWTMVVLSISSILKSFIIFNLFYEKPWSSRAHPCARWKSRTMQIRSWR